MVWNNMMMRGVENYLDEVERYRTVAIDRSPEYLQGRLDQYGESVRSCLDFILGTPAEIQAMRSVLEEMTSE